MLVELRCDKFHQKVIKFHKGMNVVLGTIDADNSIGKTTFLMILDFIFGGDDYITINADVQEHIGEHEFLFSFKFGAESFWFRRNSVDTSVIQTCNENYEVNGQISIDDYRTFLMEKYGVSLPYASFRNIVGRFSRVYGKENIDEHNPLHVAKGEPSTKAVTALLVLFELYEAIANYAKVYDEKKEKLDTFNKAQDFSFIPKVPQSKEFEKNKKLIAELKEQISELEKKLNVQLTDVDSALTSEAIELKKSLTVAKSQRSKIYSKIFKLKANMEYKNSPIETDFNLLLKYFPNSNLKEITDIEQFHKDVSKILYREFSREKQEWEKELIQIEALIASIDKQLVALISTTNISAAFLKQYSALQKRVEQLQLANDYYEQKLTLEAEKKQAKVNLEAMSNEQLTKLEIRLNAKMNEINDYLYNGEKTSPNIKFKSMNYVFFTPDDTGTGSSYKGLIVYDLSILSLTKLPFLIHDSILLKQIADSAVLNIFKLYSQCERQIFVAFDKQGSYGDECKKLLESNAVLHLAPHGQELFGVSWNVKKGK